MSDIAIRVGNLGKLYRIGPRTRYKALRDTLTDALYTPFMNLARLANPRSATRTSRTATATFGP